MEKKTERQTQRRPPGEGWQRREGLSRYWFRDRDGHMEVWSCHKKRLMTFFFRGTDIAKLQLAPDNGRPHHFSEGCLRYLLAHPEIPVSIVYASARSRVTWTRDGKLINMSDIFEKQDRRYYEFRGLDDVLSTVLLLIDIKNSGSTASLVDFAQRNRNRAIFIVTRLLKYPSVRVEDSWDDALELFLKQSSLCNFQKITPLFAMLCRSLKCRTIDRAQKMGRLTKAMTGAVFTS